MDAPELNPAQRRVLVELMALGQDRPRFGPEVAADLAAGIEAVVGPLLGDDGDTLWVNKGVLSEVHACEAHHLAAEGEDFAWTAATARGTVAHRALELSLTWGGDPAPLDLVDQAIESLCRDERRTGPGSWLLSASPLDLADLRAGANDVVAKFLECWPPLRPRWAPRTETGIGAYLCAERVTLWGKVDLVLGRARGDEARALVVDVKTGRAYPSHLDDLRFYALVQTLRIGVPPFRVASYYLDTATFHVEDVTVDTLALAARRAVDGARKVLELRRGRAPGITPGPQCSWCRLADICEGALSLRS
ncbi:MAG TPA: PD-(D/E)XK nuclease family protein [Acidimicrobiales bacterium]|nr:PD-(D/E)XK nuclease family protein [Acidimicrobiales bacterium]